MTSQTRSIMELLASALVCSPPPAPFERPFPCLLSSAVSLSFKSLSQSTLSQTHCNPDSHIERASTVCRREIELRSLFPKQTSYTVGEGTKMFRWRTFEQVRGSKRSASAHFSSLAAERESIASVMGTGFCSMFDHWPWGGGEKCLGHRLPSCGPPMILPLFWAASQ